MKNISATEAIDFLDLGAAPCRELDIAIGTALGKAPTKIGKRGAPWRNGMMYPKFSSDKKSVEICRSLIDDSFIREAIEQYPNTLSNLSKHGD